jgi:hypothetical protein
MADPTTAQDPTITPPAARVSAHPGASGSVTLTMVPFTLNTFKAGPR